MVLQERIELSTSPLPRECSTTELLQRRVTLAVCLGAWRLSSRKCDPLQPLFRAPLDPIHRLRYEGVMTDQTDEKKHAKPLSPRELARETRLKAALKANMARRKAQTKARATDTSAAKTQPDTASGTDKE